MLLVNTSSHCLLRPTVTARLVRFRCPEGIRAGTKEARATRGVGVNREIGVISRIGVSAGVRGSREGCWSSKALHIMTLLKCSRVSLQRPARNRPRRAGNSKGLLLALSRRLPLRWLCLSFDKQLYTLLGHMQNAMLPTGICWYLYAEPNLFYQEIHGPYWSSAVCMTIADVRT